MKISVKPKIYTIEGKDIGVDENVKIQAKDLSARDQIKLAEAMDTDDDKISEQFEQVAIMAKKVITGWTGLKDENGTEIKFSEKNLEGLIEYSPEFISAVLENYNNQVAANADIKKK